jgi:starch synthase
VIHCHDWHTGLIPVLALLEGRARPATAFTIHNLAYQGTFPKDAARVIGVARGSEGFRLLEMGGFLNFLKGGIVSADCVNTVSPKYAREIQTPDFGEGLDGVLRLRDEAVTGILNGIDYTEWDPATDAALAANYSRDDISGKLTCKRALQRANALPEEDVPVLGVVSRLATQKGLGLIELVLDELLAADLQFVLLGTGEPHYHELFEEVAKRLPDKTGINLKYDNTLAHRIYAGSDLFLIPSQYEPCGLTQMIALAYGTIPIVRATGGLADTVHEHGPSANGFVFFDSSPDSLIAAIDRALAAYKDDLRWRGLMENAFASNFPWERSAGEYVKLYERALDLAPAAPAMADTT